MERLLPRPEQIRGCILGGALGDAWGRPFEGLPPNRPFEIPPDAEISDDTQLTLATCESIVESRAVRPDHLSSRLAAWFAAGRITGIGASTLKAMRDLSAGTHWALAGSRGEYAAGNGAAMRVAPLAFLLDPESQSDRALIRDVCRITHHNDEAYAGALAVVAAVRAAASGCWSRENSFFAIAARALPDCAVRDRINELASSGLPVEKLPSRFGTSGWVVDSVPVALLCAQSVGEQPLSVVLAQAIELGSDTDTIASIAGQIAGAAAGLDAEHLRHVSNIPVTEDIDGIATRFAQFVLSKE